jgi:hypothetical protein
MRKNIWSHLDKIKTYIENKVNIFDFIFVWKPVKNIKGLCLFFSLENNEKQIVTDVRWTERKVWLFDFFVIWETKEMPEVEIYEAYDSFSNLILTDKIENIDLWGFTIHSITEWNQSWILRDSTDRPFLIAQIYISYTYQYN